MKSILLAMAAPLALLIAACSPDDPAPIRDTLTASPENQEKPASAPSDTDAGEGSDITLLPITGARIPEIQGELGCAFTTKAGETLLVAKADVGDEARPTAAINNSGQGATLASTQTGGFGTLEKSGARFDGRGMTITVDTMERVDDDMTETVTHKARLLVQHTDGRQQTYDGDWSCGP